MSIDELADVDTTSNPPSVGYILRWNGTNWVPATKDPDRYNFDASDGQTDFTIQGKIFNAADVLVNGIQKRDNTYTISDNGTDTTVSFDTGLNDGDWVLIKVFV
jgi:hypothetical protein